MELYKKCKPVYVSVCYHRQKDGDKTYWGGSIEDNGEYILIYSEDCMANIRLPLQAVKQIMRSLQVF